MLGLISAALYQGDHLVSIPVIPYLSNLDIARASGWVEAGVFQKQVAALFGVSQSTISKQVTNIHETDDGKDHDMGVPRTQHPQGRQAHHPYITESGIAFFQRFFR